MFRVFTNLIHMHQPRGSLITAEALGPRPGDLPATAGRRGLPGGADRGGDDPALPLRALRRLPDAPPDRTRHAPLRRLRLGWLGPLGVLRGPLLRLGAARPLLQRRHLHLPRRSTRGPSPTSRSRSSAPTRSRTGILSRRGTAVTTIETGRTELERLARSVIGDGTHPAVRRLRLPRPTTRPPSSDASVERAVFLEAFGNTPELLAAEYGPYEASSMFFIDPRPPPAAPGGGDPDDRADGGRARA